MFKYIKEHRNLSLSCNFKYTGTLVLVFAINGTDVFATAIKILSQQKDFTKLIHPLKMPKWRLAWQFNMDAFPK